MADRPIPMGGGVPAGGGGAPHSHLVEAILQMWAWGYVSAPSVQTIMAAAVKDGLEHPSVIGLAKIGASGRHPQNCHRDLQRNFLQESKIPRAVSTEVPALDTRAPVEGEVPATCPVLMPHDLFSTLAKDYPAVFATAIDDLDD